MKKIGLLFILMLLTLLADAKVQIDGIFYELDSESKTASVCRFSSGNDYSGDVVIPETIDYENTTFIVTSIGKCAFINCEALNSITIPKTVNYIGDGAFQRAKGLTAVYISDLEAWCKIVFDSNPLYLAHHLFLNGEEIHDLEIPNGITTINDRAFQGGSSINTVKIPNNVTSIGYKSFYHCGLTSVTIPEGVSKIGGEAFSGCSLLANISFPESIDSIGSGAFAETEWLSNQPDGVLYVGKLLFRYIGDMPNNTCIDIKEGTKGIADEAFSGCSGLTSVNIPNSLISIGRRAFWNCTGLESFNVPETVKRFDEAFMGCSGLKSITIPQNITSIGGGTFEGCSGLTSFTIPESVTSIDGWAFAGCSGLTSITIPENVTSIGDGAFEYCSGLTSMTIPNSVKYLGYFSFMECRSLTSVNIPISVTEIHGQTFEFCSLKTITIPQNVTTIEDEAFLCPELKEIKVLAQTPPTLYESSFYHYDNTLEVQIKVPKGCVEAYKTAPIWSRFENIVEIDEQTITIGGKGKTTYCGNKSLDFSSFENLKAYVATGYESDGTIWLTRIKQVPANTPILIKGEADQTYEVPVMDKCNAYFENMFKGSTDEDLIISTTTEDGKYKNFYMSGGQFKPASASQKISAGKTYLQVPANFKAATTGEDQTVKIADSGKSSYAPPVDIDLTNVEGLKAYASTGYDAATSTIWLTRINKIQAGEGVLLKGEAGKEYTLPSAEVQAYYSNMFVGNIDEKITINETSDDCVWTNYYLASGSFKKVSGSREIGTNKSYLHLPTSLLVSSARGKQNSGIEEWFMDELETDTLLLGSIGGDDEDGTTRIDAISNDNTQPDVYYNLQGQRVDNPKKGLYIHNGRKVVVK